MTACSLFEERADDFAWCEDVIRRNSHSFYRAFSLLPACKRQSVYALYAFCRLADDSRRPRRQRGEARAGAGRPCAVLRRHRGRRSVVARARRGMLVVRPGRAALLRHAGRTASRPVVPSAGNDGRPGGIRLLRGRVGGAHAAAHPARRFSGGRRFARQRGGAGRGHAADQHPARRGRGLGERARLPARGGAGGGVVRAGGQARARGGRVVPATLGRRWRTARRSCTAPWSAT